MSLSTELAEAELRASEIARRRAADREETAQDAGQLAAARAEREYWERQIADARAYLAQLRRPAGMMQG